jgi:iron complex outermembrane receptor protein
MNATSCLRRLWPTLFQSIIGLCLLSAVAQAQSASTGAITGRVFNPVTKEYVRNAEVRVEGADQFALTGSDGYYQISNVPAGETTVSVAYTGYAAEPAKVTVGAGMTATHDFELKSTVSGTKGSNDVVQMEAFAVSTEREGNAKAIMDQKHSMNVSNIVAAETFGNIAEGNIGEFIKYLPGIQMDYVEADARSPRIRGLPAQYTTVTFDGMDLATADGFIQNNGTDNGGGAGAGGRSFGFEQVSMSSIDAVEVNFTTNASQSAGGAAGNINLRPKHAYERSGQLITFDVSAFANSEQFYWHKVVRPDDKPERLVRPNAMVEYSNSFFNHRLGIIASINESNSYNEQRQFVPAYDSGTTAAPLPTVITRIQYKDGAKFTERTTGSFTIDFKATRNLSLSLIGTINSYGAFVGNRSFGVSTTRANVTAAGAGDGWTTWNNVPITGLTAAASSAYLNKRTHGYTYLPSFEYKLHNLTVNGSIVISTSENNYAGGQSKSLPGNNLGNVSLATTGITVSASRPADDLYAWQVVQTAGPSWSDLSNYKAPATSAPTFGIDGRFNRVEIYQGKLDAKFVTSWKMPTYLKAGGKVSETTYMFRNPTNWQTWNYIGPGGGNGGSWSLYPSAYPFSQGHDGFLLSTTGGTPAVADHNVVGKLFEEHPEYFVLRGNAADYFTGFISTPKYVKEQVDSLYGMFNSRPFKNLQVEAGVRWERTRDEKKDFDPLTSAQVAAAGFAIGTNGQATTIPGMQYQYFTKPRAARSSSYGEFFPSGSLKYKVRPNLEVLAGYSYSITRPAYGDLSGTYSEDDTKAEISAPNPNLKPQFADNYSARVMYYFEPVGSFGVGVFENDFKNFVQNTRIPGGAADAGFTDPFYASYTLVQKDNIDGKVRYRGATIEYSQALSFLPEPFKGLNVFANYTRTYTKVLPPDESLLHVSGNAYNFGWLPGIAPHVVNYGVSYKYKRASLGVRARWTADMPTTTTFNTYMQQNTKVDVSASFDVTPRLNLYVSTRNIFNVPDHTYIGTERQRIGGGRSIEYYGTYVYVGVKGRF